MALAINISSFVSGGYTVPIRWDLREKGTGILIDSHTESGMHGVAYNFSFVNNIRDIVYEVEMWEVTGSIGNFLKGMDVTPSTSTLIMDTDIELIVDGGQSYDPVSGNDTVIVPATIGKDCYLVQQGYGQLREERSPEYTFDPANGTWVLLGGVKFSGSDTYFIKSRPKFVVNPLGSVSPTTVYKAVELITSDRSLSSVDFGKLLIADGTTPVVTVQFPHISTIIEKVPVWIEHIGTASNYLVMKAETGELITAIGTTSNTFILGRGERAQFIKLGSVLYGFTDSTDIKRVGQFDWSYTIGLNRAWADGTECLVDDFPRIKKAMDNSQVGVVLDYTTWAATTVINGVAVPINKGKFALKDYGGGIVKFKFPDLRNKYLRALAGTGTDPKRLSQGSGGYMPPEVGPHIHGSGLVGSASGSGTVYLKYGGTTDFGPLKLVNTASNSGTETNTENIGLIPSIIL